MRNTQAQRSCGVLFSAFVNRVAGWGDVRNMGVWILVRMVGGLDRYEEGEVFLGAGFASLRSI